MKTKILLLFIICFSHIHAQDTNNLDTKYGFNKFKLETPFSQLKSVCKYLSSFEGADMYRYTGSQIEGIFGYFNVKTLNLYFYKGKLKEIEIIFGSLTLENNEYINRKLLGLYGYPQRQIPSNESYEFCDVWLGQKTTLLFQNARERLSFPSQASIRVISQKISKQQENDKF
jgi:hypothetical protein